MAAMWVAISTVRGEVRAAIVEKVNEEKLPMHAVEL
jgi:hypothetical protein